MDKNTKIYIAGHTGFVGSNLLHNLKNDNYTNLIYAPKKELNLFNLQKINNFLNKHKPEIIFNCAAIVGGISANMNNKYKFLIENLTIQNNLIDSAINNKTKIFLNLASSCCYPKDYIQPLKEEYLMKDKLEDTNEGYGLAKLCSIKLCEYANTEIGSTKFITLMPSNIYGTGDNFSNLQTSHVLSAMIIKIYNAKKNNEKFVEFWGDGTPKREFLYVEDLVDCMIWSIDNLKDFNQSHINVGTGYDVSIKKLSEMISEIIDYKGIIKFNNNKSNGMMKKCLDVSKINSLGWKASTKLYDGLLKTINYYRNLNDKIDR